MARPSLADSLWNADAIGGVTLLVALGLVRLTGGEGEVTVPVIASFCGVSDKQVRSALKRLESAGLLAVEKRPGRPNLYRLTPTQKGTPAQIDTPTQKGRGTPTQKGTPPLAERAGVRKYNANVQLAKNQHDNTPDPYPKGQGSESTTPGITPGGNPRAHVALSTISTLSTIKSTTEQSTKNQPDMYVPPSEPMVDPLAKYPILAKHFDRLAALVRARHPRAPNYKPQTGPWRQARNVLGQIVRLDSKPEAPITEQDIVDALTWLFEEYEPNGFDHADKIRSLASMRRKWKDDDTAFGHVLDEWRRRRPKRAEAPAPEHVERHTFPVLIDHDAKEAIRAMTDNQRAALMLQAARREPLLHGGKIEAGTGKFLSVSVIGEEDCIREILGDQNKTPTVAPAIAWAINPKGGDSI